MSTIPSGRFPGVLGRLLLFVVVIPLLPQIISGKWDWWQAWVNSAICILGFGISRVLTAKKHPDVIAERAKFMSHKNIQPWDRILASLVGASSAFIFLVSGLQARLIETVNYSIWAEMMAILLISAGFGFGSYALYVNRFFSGVVRLQTERNHTLVDSGPYRWIRHPGYLGGIITYTAMPVLLESTWAFIPAVLFVISLIIRTRLEDRFLQQNLTGYREYAARVRYRLVPLVW